MAGKKTIKPTSGGRQNPKVRIHNNKIVSPTMLYASNTKRKLVGTIDGEIVYDNKGTPIPFKQIGYLDYPENLQKDL
jgi:hypothetical protein